MATIYLADDKVLMCEICDIKPAQYYTEAPTPQLLYSAICAKCAADICLKQNDIVGYSHFMERVI